MDSDADVTSWPPAGIGRPPPLLREDRVTLANLSALAREFDALSRDDGRDWPAVRFVEWLRDEYRATAERPAADEAA